MDCATTAVEAKQRLTNFMASAASSTRQIVCEHARLSVDGLRVVPGPTRIGTCGAASNSDATLLHAERSRILWPMRADAKLAALPVGGGEGVDPTGPAVGQDVLCFLFDTLTSAHLTVMTGRRRHVSVSIGVEFAEPLCVEQPFTLTSCLLRVGRRICCLTAEVHQRKGGRRLLCARADHLKAFYTESPQHNSHPPASKL
ncbi:uncharacterized protein Tco025E_07673 [Trypanosoma conorhini]|uniref:Uncharacterized protein n=1 Tax=Trypanosoma conorhini TaxID=83891 RepID=A0A3R7KDW5_9TRYP|nr:uncharacterized protein Tco025E_07673 [Trypanosoma conorhini]RNF06058.1 hypothetical protein Tco025E_07673 [Trypanosoma conorhini]